MTGKVAGIILIVSGIAVCVIGAAVFGVFTMAGLTASGVGVGVILLGVISLPLFGAGVFLIIKSGQEGKDDEIIAKQRKILDMVAARGQVRISDLALELKSSREQVQNWIYNLVGMGLFSGYINWEDGVLYSMQASQLKDKTTCMRCGGQVTLAGKGVSKCQHCGTEYFL